MDEASSPGLSEFAVGAKQSRFELQTVRVAVDEIRVGDDVQVFVRITNDGGADGSFVANLLIDDAVAESRELTIAAGGRRQVRFERTLEETGSYTVQVNDAIAGEVVVTRDSDEVTTSDSSSTAAASGSGVATTAATGDLGGSSLVVPAVVGALALTGVLVGYSRRRTD